MKLILSLFLAFNIVACNEYAKIPKDPENVEPPLNPATICSGTTINGVAGFMADFKNGHYSRGGKVLTLSRIYEESDALGFKNLLTQTYFTGAPDASIDNDGISMSTYGGRFKDKQHYFSVIYGARPSTDCGSGGATIQDKIDDCATNNPGMNTYNGLELGQAAEGKWTLVRKNGSIEVWRDEKTRLLWSSIVANNINWFKASGSNDSNLGYAMQGTDCGGGDCQTTPSITQTCPAAFSLDSFSGTIWKLPSVDDFRIAFVNGYIKVMSQDFDAWTSTSATYPKSEAWYVHSSGGTINQAARAQEKDVICVGYTFEGGF